MVVEDAPRRAHGSEADEVRRATGEVVAFHWTKVDGRTGEVYVVGVDPAHQGRGLGGPVTRLGLAHLARLGLGEVELYVDGDNTAARRTYERLGFTDAAVDGQYTRAAT
jgi:mycothiol synthase